MIPNKIDLQEITEFLIRAGIEESPDAAVILGSGLGGFAASIENRLSIPYSRIPGFPSTSVKGHSGELISGSVNGRNIIAFSGRFHHYEGHDFATTILPVSVSGAIGAKKLVISNAAGAINRTFGVGDLMAIEDVIRPVGMIYPFGSEKFRFTRQGSAARIARIGAGAGLFIRSGTYIYVKGPNYETKAEVRAFRRLNADVAGMSTVPEMMEASRLGIKTAAVSLVTNMAAGVLRQKLDHEEVKTIAEKKKADFAKLVNALIEEF